MATPNTLNRRERMFAKLKSLANQVKGDNEGDPIVTSSKAQSASHLSSDVIDPHNHNRKFRLDLTSHLVHTQNKTIKKLNGDNSYHQQTEAERISQDINTKSQRKTKRNKAKSQQDYCGEIEVARNADDMDMFRFGLPADIYPIIHDTPEPIIEGAANAFTHHVSNTRNEELPQSISYYGQNEVPHADDVIKPHHDVSVDDYDVIESDFEADLMPRRKRPAHESSVCESISISSEENAGSVLYASDTDSGTSMDTNKEPNTGTGTPFSQSSNNTNNETVYQSHMESLNLPNTGQNDYRLTYVNGSVLNDTNAPTTPYQPRTQSITHATNLTLNQSAVRTPFNQQSPIIGKFPTENETQFENLEQKSEKSGLTSSTPVRRERKTTLTNLTAPPDTIYEEDEFHALSPISMPNTSELSLDSDSESSADDRQTSPKSRKEKKKHEKLLKKRAKLTAKSENSIDLLRMRKQSVKNLSKTNTTKDDSSLDSSLYKSPHTWDKKIARFIVKFLRKKPSDNSTNKDKENDTTKSWLVIDTPNNSKVKNNSISRNNSSISEQNQMNLSKITKKLPNGDTTDISSKTGNGVKHRAPSTTSSVDSGCFEDSFGSRRTSIESNNSPGSSVCTEENANSEKLSAQGKSRNALDKTKSSKTVTFSSTCQYVDADVKRGNEHVKNHMTTSTNQIESHLSHDRTNYDGSQLSPSVVCLESQHDVINQMTTHSNKTGTNDESHCIDYETNSLNAKTADEISAQSLQSDIRSNSNTIRNQSISSSLNQGPLQTKPQIGLAENNNETKSENNQDINRNKGKIINRMGGNTISSCESADEAWTLNESKSPKVIFPYRKFSFKTTPKHSKQRDGQVTWFKEESLSDSVTSSGDFCYNRRPSRTLKHHVKQLEFSANQEEAEPCDVTPRRVSSVSFWSMSETPARSETSSAGDRSEDSSLDTEYEVFLDSQSEYSIDNDVRGKDNDVTNAEVRNYSTNIENEKTQNVVLNSMPCLSNLNDSLDDTTSYNDVTICADDNVCTPGNSNSDLILKTTQNLTEKSTSIENKHDYSSTADNKHVSKQTLEPNVTSEGTKRGSKVPNGYISPADVITDLNNTQSEYKEAWLHQNRPKSEIMKTHSESTKGSLGGLAPQPGTIDLHLAFTHRSLTEENNTGVLEPKSQETHFHGQKTQEDIELRREKGVKNEANVEINVPKMRKEEIETALEALELDPNPDHKTGLKRQTILTEGLHVNNNGIMPSDNSLQSSISVDHDFDTSCEINSLVLNHSHPAHSRDQNDVSIASEIASALSNGFTSSCETDEYENVKPNFTSTPHGKKINQHFPNSENPSSEDSETVDSVSSGSEEFPVQIKPRIFYPRYPTLPLNLSVDWENIKDENQVTTLDSFHAENASIMHNCDVTMSNSRAHEMLSRRREHLHKAVEHWYKKISLDLDTTQEHGTSALHSQLSPRSQQYRTPPRKTVSFLNINHKIDPRIFGTLSAANISTPSRLAPETCVLSFYMKEPAHQRSFETRDSLGNVTGYMATALSLGYHGDFIVTDLGADTCRIFTSNGRLKIELDTEPLCEPTYAISLVSDNIACKPALSLTVNNNSVFTKDRTRKTSETKSINSQDKECIYGQERVNESTQDLTNTDKIEENILIACRNGLHLYSSLTGACLSAGIGKTDIKCPQCIALDGTGNILISDMLDGGSVITTLDRHSQMPIRFFCGRQFGLQDDESSFRKAWYFCVTISGDVIISDRESHMIKAYSPHGEFLWWAGGLGGGLGKLSQPAGVTVDALGNILVADMGNHRIQMFSGCGQWLAVVLDGQIHDINIPMDLAIDSDGNLAVLQDSGTVSIFKYLHRA